MTDAEIIKALNRKLGHLSDQPLSPDGLGSFRASPSVPTEGVTASGDELASPRDPMERRIAVALDRDGIPYTTDPDRTSGLDFLILNAPVHIEVKRFHSPRIAEQMSRAENVIAVQGKEAVTWLAARMHNHASVVALKRDQEARKNEWRARALAAEAEAAEWEQAAKVEASQKRLAEAAHQGPAGYEPKANGQKPIQPPPVRGLEPVAFGLYSASDVSALQGEVERLRRLLKQRDRLAENSRKFWMRAGEAALNGNMRELRTRVDMAKAEPVSVVLSDQALGEQQ